MELVEGEGSALVRGGERSGDVRGSGRRVEVKRLEKAEVYVEKKEV